MQKFSVKEILAFICLIIFTVILAGYSFVADNIKRSLVDVPGLIDNIDVLEDRMGGYSDYYVVVDKDTNFILHSIAGANIENTIVVLIPKGVSKANVILDFYTGWDEKLGSYKCDFERYPEYVVNNKIIQCQQSDLPFVFIDVGKEDFNRVNASFSEQNPVKEKAAIEFTVCDMGSGWHIKGIQGQIKPRGAVSWTLFNKRPYSVKFVEKIDLFGMGKYKKWNLIANGSDKTLLKNEIFYGMADNLGLQYTPKTEQVNLFINDDYKGVYTITTKVDAFTKSELGINDFLINWGSPNCSNKIEYDCLYETIYDEETGKPFFDIVWPENVGGYKSEIIKEKVQEFVDVLEGRKDGDLVDYIDFDSLVRYYWVQEISMNVDAFYRSFYMYYKADDGKFYTGPIWDMDCTLGVTGIDREGLDFTVPYGWKIREYGCYKTLFENDLFCEKVKEFYYSENIESLMEATYAEYVNRVEELECVGELNYELTKEDNNFYDLNCVDVNSYREYSDRKLKFFRDRIDWIENEMGAR